ncbi:SMP-30/gluconolactonase/LRE family protein [Marilutibacter aestuarii]|uniref:SMP-30/gluconolactonase/LRE family protein n=1 Tax=Marilutibacter aestuarii TaxID=1706195 RepID=A0A507ZUR3_9GAMM|nr:SMP-30/gluconolactonase/LRE family protein [Lysobacter aestuarii]TQD40341.1 SMP-30/gluconolactonase/LRE family protein [Lysobacter aestuarii]
MKFRPARARIAHPAPRPPLPALAACLATALAAACSHAPHAPAGPGLYQAWDVVEDGVFTAGVEGPAVAPDGALHAVGFGRDGTVGRVVVGADGRGRATLFAELPEGSIGNGIRFDDDGHLLVADYAGHQVLRLTPDGRDATTYAALPGAHQPNDIARAPDGTLYASDPDWASGSGQLWQVRTDGSVRRLESGMGTTNGIEVSPDGRRLYVNESVQRKVWAYDIEADGGVSGKRLLLAFPDHGLDGMRCDVEGNLYIARYDAGTVAVVSPDGRVLREVALRGRKPTNVAFGGADGRTVFVTLQDRGAIEAFRNALPGREWGPLQ